MKDKLSQLPELASKVPEAASAFPQWLRSNSEFYLLPDSQARMAEKTGIAGPAEPRSLKDKFFRQVFAPVYRKLPWEVRQRTIQALPGSHRRDWPPLEDDELHEPAI